MLKQLFILGLFLSQAAISAPAIFNGSDVKILKDNIQLNDKAHIRSGTVDPTTSATTGTPGSIYLNTSNGKVYRKTDSGSSTNWVAMSSGGDAGVNYIANPDGEANTAGWSTYADAAGASPVDCTGGSPTLTWTRSTTSPLRGTGNFLATKDAANRQGEGVSYDFAIDRVDQAKAHTISLEFEVGSGTFQQGNDSQVSDLAVYVYDVTNSTIIQPAGYKLTGGATGQFKYQGNFQTASNSQSYRLCLHQAVSGTSAYTLKVDSVSVGPSAFAYGAPVTDWASYTPTFSAGFGTVTGITAEWRRIGDTIQSRGVATAGTVAGSAMTISWPTGVAHAYSADTVLEGAFITAYNGTSQAGMVPLAFSAATGNFSIGLNNSASGFTARNGNSALTNGLAFSWWASAKVTGWGSSVVMSSDADTRVVALKRQNSAGTTLTRNTLNSIPFATAVVDTHGAFATDTYTVPVAGVYAVAVNLMISTAVTWAGGDYARIAIVKNGSVDTDYYNVQPGANANNVNVELTALLNCVAGDTIKIQLDPHIAGAGTPALNASASQNSLNIFRLSGPASIAASETVAASYRIGSNRTVSYNSVTIIDFDTVVKDTHGATTTGSSWKFTAPVSGVYRISSRLESNAGVTVDSTSRGVRLDVYKNGSLFRAIDTNYDASGTSKAWVVRGSTQVSLLAGDYIDLRVYQDLDSGGSDIITFAAGVSQYVDVEKIGGTP